MRSADMQPRELTETQAQAAIDEFRALKHQIDALEARAENVVLAVEHNAQYIAGMTHKLPRTGMAAHAEEDIPDAGADYIAFEFYNGYDDDRASATYSAAQLADPDSVVQAVQRDTREKELAQARAAVQSARRRLDELESR